MSDEWITLYFYFHCWAFLLKLGFFFLSLSTTCSTFWKWSSSFELPTKSFVIFTALSAQSLTTFSLSTFDLLFKKSSFFDQVQTFSQRKSTFKLRVWITNQLSSLMRSDNLVVLDISGNLGFPNLVPNLFVGTSGDDTGFTSSSFWARDSRSSDGTASEKIDRNTSSGVRYQRCLARALCALCFVYNFISQKRFI